ncbi:MAG: hypothetical protein Fur007_00670 [Rhodoferax sp.]
MKSLLSAGVWLMARSSLNLQFAWLFLPGTLAGLVFLVMALMGTLDATAVAVGLALAGLVAFYLLAALRWRWAHGLQKVDDSLAQMMAGNLRAKPQDLARDPLAEVVARSGLISQTISAMVANVRSNAAFVAHAGAALSRSSRELAERTESQASNLEQTAASVTELSEAVRENAGMAQQASSRAGAVRDLAESGVGTMSSAIGAIERIQSSSQRMEEIIGVIDGLAFQTNILALNAAVEAARAGESGRGFAVVASEVRSLAQRSAEASKEIRGLITQSTAQVRESVAGIQQAGAQLSQIVASIREVAQQMQHIAHSSEEQSSGLAQISDAVHQLDSITQSNSHMVEYASAKAADLDARAATLIEGFAKFQLQQGTPEEAVALVERARQLWDRTADKNLFVRAITDPANSYFDRDMYVFVLDRAGHYLSFGGNPAKVGSLVQDIPGIQGQKLVDDIFDQAAVEPGWVEYDITNPVTGKVQTKMSYVMMLDDWAVGCGVYKNLAQ